MAESVARRRRARRNAWRGVLAAGTYTGGRRFLKSPGRKDWWWKRQVVVERLNCSWRRVPWRAAALALTIWRGCVGAVTFSVAGNAERLKRLVFGGVTSAIGRRRKCGGREAIRSNQRGANDLDPVPINLFSGAFLAPNFLFLVAWK